MEFSLVLIKIGERFILKLCEWSFFFSKFLNEFNVLPDEMRSVRDYLTCVNSCGKSSKKLLCIKALREEMKNPCQLLRTFIIVFLPSVKMSFMRFPGCHMDVYDFTITWWHFMWYFCARQLTSTNVCILAI